jgi:hypothetical protein
MSTIWSLSCLIQLISNKHKSKRDTHKRQTFSNTRTREEHKTAQQNYNSKELLKSLSSKAKAWMRCLSVVECSMEAWYPKGPRSRWSSIWQALVALCPRVHQTIRCTPNNEQCNGRESHDCYFLLLGVPDRPEGGTGPSGARPDHWSVVDVATSHWLASTSDGPALRMDGR